MARSLHSLWLVCAVLLLATSARALEVRQALWGFDGRAVPNRFDPVSLLLTNPGSRAFDGEVVLEESRGLNIRDAEVAQAVYLAPQTERWVQFQIFVREGSEFRLRWGRGAKESAEIASPVSGPPARVLLTDPSNPFAVAGGLRAFPDDLFPTTVAATDGLDAVALDHVPRWEAARREAFLDWLTRGGIVMLLHGSGGEYPQFSEALAVLNIAGDSARVSAGTVLRQPATRREASEKLFADRGFPAPELKTNKTPVVHDLESTLFTRLSLLTRPQVSWWLLNSLTFLYILLIGPVHYRWAKKQDYRVAILTFIGTVAVFGWLFAIVGRRGYGESQTVHSLSIAHSLGGGRCDVMQWLSAFATRGDIYTLTHIAPANYYSAVPQADAVRGRIYNGKDGRFVADIPLYSARPFVHRAVMQGDDTSVTVEKWEFGNKLTLRPGPKFPREVVTMHVRHQNRIYTLKPDGERWVVQPGGETIGDAMKNERLQPLTYGFNFTNNDERPDDSLRKVFPLLEARALDGTSAFYQSIDRPTPTPDRAQLWIFARAPDGFRMRGQGFDKENGYVLYVQDIFQPQPAAPAH